MRDNEETVETNLKTQFSSQAAAQWLGLRLQFIGVAVVTGVGVIAIIQHQYDVVDPGNFFKCYFNFETLNTELNDLKCIIAIFWILFEALNVIALFLIFEESYLNFR